MSPGKDIAGDGAVEVGVGGDEDVWLDHVDLVQVLAEDGGQRDLAQLLQLVCTGDTC